MLDSEKHAEIWGKVGINKIVTRPIQQKYMKPRRLEKISR